MIYCSILPWVLFKCECCSLSLGFGRGFVECCAPLRLQHPFVSDLSSSRRRRRCGETGVNLRVFRPRMYPVLVIALPSETVQEHLQLHWWIQFVSCHWSSSRLGWDRLFLHQRHRSIRSSVRFCSADLPPFSRRGLVLWALTTSTTPGERTLHIITSYYLRVLSLAH